MKDPKVSIVMPVYNGGHYFELALKSALAQTYRNLEIVIVNDGSTDKGETAAIAETYAARHPHIKYVYQNNRGAGGALNTAIEAMTGDIFTWLSHDDLFEPHKTARQVAFFERLGRDDAMLFSDWYQIGPRGELLTEVRYDHRELVRNPRLALIGGKINGITIFIPRQHLVDAGGFDERYRFVQDYDLWNRLIERHDFFHMDETLASHRAHPGQDSLKPGALIESDDLWIRITDNRGEAEKVHLSGSSYRFSKFMVTNPGSASFAGAVAHAEVKAAETLRDTLVSLVVPADADDAALRETLASIRVQAKARIETVVVDMSPGRDLAEALAGEDLRVVPAPGEDFWAAVDEGVFQAFGDYIGVLRPGTRLDPLRTWKQAMQMQIKGRTISYTGYTLRESGAAGEERAVPVRGDLLSAHLGRSQVRLETLMIHSAELLGGFRFSGWSDDDVFLSLARRGQPLAIAEPLVTLMPGETG